MSKENMDWVIYDLENLKLEYRIKGEKAKKDQKFINADWYFRKVDQYEEAISVLKSHHKTKP